MVASPPVSLAGIESSIAGIQDYIDTHITPALAGASGDIRTLEQEKANLNLPNVFTKSNVWQDDQDQRLFAIQEGGFGAQNSPRVMYYGMALDSFDIVNKQTMDKAIEKAAGSGNAAQRDEDNVFTENNEFEKPIKVAQGGSSSHACTNAQLGTQRVELDNEINNLQGQVDVLDGRVGANEDALGDLGPEEHRSRRADRREHAEDRRAIAHASGWCLAVPEFRRHQQGRRWHVHPGQERRQSAGAQLG